MNSTKYSEQDFLNFLDYVSKKGLVKKATAKNWKNASLRLLDILEDNERQDLRNLDIDDLCTKFMNLDNGSVTPSSIQVYKSRFKTAINDFIAYKDNPVSYKPGISQRSSRKKIQKKRNENKDNLNNDTPRFSNYGNNVTGITFPIPLRENLVIEIKNLPHDLTEQESEKISMVIKALAVNKIIKE